LSGAPRSSLRRAGLLDCCREFLWLPWLLEDSCDAELAGLLEQWRRLTLTGRHDDWGGCVARPVPEFTKKLDAIHIRHLEVQHDRIKWFQAAQDLQRPTPVLRLMEFVLPAGKGQPCNLPNETPNPRRSAGACVRARLGGPRVPAYGTWE
jgi:hypothetical protein